MLGYHWATVDVGWADITNDYILTTQRVNMTNILFLLNLFSMCCKQVALRVNMSKKGKLHTFPGHLIQLYGLWALSTTIMFQLSTWIQIVHQ